jgi:hypothetical protein
MVITDDDLLLVSRENVWESNGQFIKELVRLRDS